MIYGSVCSGIEAASVAWHPLGWKAAFLSEIEPFPRAVLQHHYPDVPLHGDFTTIEKGMYEPIELLVGGTPCQSFSVAGLRGGLDDERGNLALEFLRLAQRLRPTWVVWENVPGVLSSNGGRDFGSILGGMAELGYGWAYRVLDAQHFGVPQRRRRVFVVGHLGDWRRAAAVLFERHSLQGHPAPRREAGKVAAAGTLRSTGGGCDVDHGRAGHLQAFGGNNTSGPIDVATAVRAHGTFHYDFESETFLAGTLQAGGKAAGSATQQDAESGMLVPVAFDCKASGQSGFGVGEVASTMRAMGHAGSHQNGGGHLAVAVSLRGREGGATAELGDEVGNCLRASGGGGDKAHVLAAMQVRRLTPVECERLQGFPDNHTLIPLHRKKPTDALKFSADGPRYKALGNSMAVPCMAWIGQRIQMVDAIAEAQKEGAA